MTSPEDPNAPQGSGELAPGQPAPPAPPADTQPGWAALPPNQPGWGAPPPPPQPQPGWGAPPPAAGYPGWGAQPPPGYPGWGQPGWGPPPRKKGHGCLIAALIVVGLLVVLVAGCAWVVGPIIGTEVKLNQDLGPRATSVEFNWNNGATTFVIHLAPGYESQAEKIACQIVKPDLRTSSTPDAHFEIVSFRGYVAGRRNDPLRLTPGDLRADHGNGPGRVDPTRSPPAAPWMVRGRCVYSRQSTGRS